MKYYLAYGSNLNKAQMAHRCPGAVAVGTSMIHGYKLVFRRGYLTIEPKAESCVPVGIWRISEDNEQALDHYEGYPKFYRKETFDVPYEGAVYHGEIPCMVYIMNDGYEIQRATREYLQTVAQGYRDFGFAQRWLMDADFEAAMETYTTRNTTKL